MSWMSHAGAEEERACVQARCLFPEDGFARSWQWYLGSVDAGGRLARFLGKPPGEIGPAAIAGGQWILILAGRFAARAVQPEMEVIVVPPPGS